MRVLFASDIHVNPTHLFTLLALARETRARATLVGGDIFPHALPVKRLGAIHAQEVYTRDTLLPALLKNAEEGGPPVFLDLANDDFIYPRRLLEQENGHGFHLLHKARHPLSDHLDVIGYMCVPITPFGRKDWEKPDTREKPWAETDRPVSLRGDVSKTGARRPVTLDPLSPDTLENDLDGLSALVRGPFVFVSHAPPYGTPLDVLHSGYHAGSLAVRDFIRRHALAGNLVVSLHGHIHESPRMSGSAVWEEDGAFCLNAGQSETLLHYAVLDLPEARGERVRIEAARTFPGTV
jgi:Icc-related predicted phosphoesterase